MKLNAVGVKSKNFEKTVEFYTILGFSFPKFSKTDGHLEAMTKNGSARLMIDSPVIIKDIIGQDPKPGNHSSFAIEYDSIKEIEDCIAMLKKHNFTVFREPWNAFWGQYYAIAEDPDGYKIDLYANLSNTSQ